MITARSLSYAGLALGLLAAAPAALAQSYYGPSSLNGTVSIDATVYHDAPADRIGLNLSCEITKPLSRAEIREDANRRMNLLAGVVGEDGKVRRSGSPMVYPYYAPISSFDEFGNPLPVTEPATPTFTGTVNLSITEVKKESAQRIADAVEDMGCNVNWDVQIVNTTSYIRTHRAALMAQISEKKEAFEEILGKKLTKISSLSSYTSPYYGYWGGSGNFDGETLSVPAQTTLNISYWIENDAPANSR